MMNKCNDVFIPRIRNNYDLSWGQKQVSKEEKGRCIPFSCGRGYEGIVERLLMSSGHLAHC